MAILCTKGPAWNKRTKLHHNFPNRFPPPTQYHNTKWRYCHQLTSIGSLLNTETCIENDFSKKELNCGLESRAVGQAWESRILRRARVLAERRPQNPSVSLTLFASDMAPRWKEAVLCFQKNFGKLPKESFGLSTSKTETPLRIICFVVLRN